MLLKRLPAFRQKIKKEKDPGCNYVTFILMRGQEKNLPISPDAFQTHVSFSVQRLNAKWIKVRRSSRGNRGVITIDWTSRTYDLNIMSLVPRKIEKGLQKQN